MKSLIKQSGFTLLEVLVAILIFAIGLLGLASLQTVGQRTNHSAYLRSQAVIQAYDIADRIRANKNLPNLAPNLTELEKLTMLANLYQLDEGRNVTSDCSLGSGSESCSTPADIARYDLWEWETATEQHILPQGDTSISFSNGHFLITIKWDDTADNEDNDLGDSIFNMKFRP